MPTIDKDDENATRYEATVGTVTLDEQISAQEELIVIHKREGWHEAEIEMDAAILASLRELQRIRSAERPEEPPEVTRFRNHSDIRVWGPIERHIDALTAYADRMAAERDAANKRAADLEEIAHNAEAVALQNTGARLAAESKLTRVEKLLREPSEGMLKVGKSNGPDAHIRPTRRIWKVMSAELLRQVEGE